MRISSNMLWNLGGVGLPMLAAFFAVPVLIAGLGVERFGMLSLAWVFAGYFSVFDFGLGRALTQMIAQKIGERRDYEISSFAASGMICLCALGVVGGIVFALCVPWVAGKVIPVSSAFYTEGLISFFILAASIPVVIVGSGLRGILEGYQRFDIVNMVRIPVSVLTYLGPLLLLPYANTLPPVILLLLLARLVMALSYFFVVLRMYPGLLEKKPVDFLILKRLFSFGGWMTLSNIVGPLLLYMGRMVLAVIISAEAVAYFSTPYEVIINLILIPGVFVSTLFPVFSERFFRDTEYVGALYNKSVFYLSLVMLPLCLLAFFLVKPGLSWWISKEFAEKSSGVAQILIVGVFINSFGYIPQALVQACGRPDWTAKLHVFEFMLHIPYLYFLVLKYGIEGAAFAWGIRVTISTIILWVLANRCFSERLNGNFKVRIQEKIL